MPQGLIDLKRRIKSVQTTKKITQAMKLVSAAKFRRVEEKAIASRPYSDAIGEMMHAVSRHAKHAKDPLLTVREVQQVTYIVITGDRGLSGPYNAQILRKVLAEIGQQEKDVSTNIVAVGRKGRDFLRRRQLPMVAEFIPVGDEPGYSLAKEIADTVIKLYASEKTDAVYLIFSEFHSIMVQIPVVVSLLPLIPQKTDEKETESTRYLFEPDADAVLADLIPRYLESIMYRALLEAKASEHGARMTAMDAASKNADKMTKNLTLLMNRARQAAITAEIAEIVGGAAALE